MEINKVLSEEMWVTPLKAGETATFCLLNAGVTEPGRETPACPEVVALNDREMVYDPIQKQKVMIYNIIGLTQERENGKVKLRDGSPVMMPLTARPVFKKGFLYLTDQDNDQYGFLMRSKKNDSNPFAGKGRKVFKLMSSKKDIQDQQQVEDLRYRAEKIIRESEWLELEGIAASLNASPDKRLHVSTRDLKGMKLELIRLTKTFAKMIVYASHDTRSKKVVQVYECQNFNILVFEEDKQTWFLNHKDKFTKLHQVDPEKDKVESLVDYFETEKGEAHYAQTTNVLSTIFKAKMAVQTVQ